MWRYAIKPSLSSTVGLILNNLFAVTKIKTCVKHLQLLKSLNIRVKLDSKINKYWFNMLNKYVRVLPKLGEFSQLSKYTGGQRLVKSISTCPVLQERSNYSPSYYYKMNSKHLSKDSLQPPTTEKIRIYSMRFCPFAQRALLVLIAKGIPHDVVNCNLKEKPTWLKELNPLEKVPIVELPGGKVIYESLIVADYFDEMFEARRLRAVDHVQKAIDRIWIDRFGKAIANFYKVLFAIPKDDQETIQKYLPRFATGLKDLDKELSERKTKFFGGDDLPGMLDYMIWPWIERYPVFKAVIPAQYSDDVQKLTNDVSTINRWTADMMQDFAVKEFILPIEVHKEFIQSLLSGSPNYNILDAKL
ncbi:pyrimidodiazepine synthase isoform X2 [Folsomia candida]|uniref:pyrimidodiazepine synthase isoform X2 n=1 Tax=Folsomia candida TaxID=158441 RepID=UPI000B8FE69A|nr:pyrimidodiazepine synthase isoform X2 [Folsomia candida]